MTVLSFFYNCTLSSNLNYLDLDWFIYMSFCLIPIFVIITILFMHESGNKTKEMPEGPIEVDDDTKEPNCPRCEDAGFIATFDLGREYRDNIIFPCPNCAEGEKFRKHLIDNKGKLPIKWW
jgi:hypothetical protein